jgi:hypothetical protein
MYPSQRIKLSNFSRLLSMDEKSGKDSGAESAQEEGESKSAKMAKKARDFGHGAFLVWWDMGRQTASRGSNSKFQNLL